MGMYPLELPRPKCRLATQIPITPTTGPSTLIGRALSLRRLVSLKQIRRFSVMMSKLLDGVHPPSARAVLDHPALARISGCPYKSASKVTTRTQPHVFALQSAEVWRSLLHCAQQRTLDESCKVRSRYHTTPLRKNKTRRLRRCACIISWVVICGSTRKLIACSTNAELRCHR